MISVGQSQYDKPWKNCQRSVFQKFDISGGELFQTKRALKQNKKWSAYQLVRGKTICYQFDLIKSRILLRPNV